MRSQALCQIAVEFNHCQVSQALHQGLRQRRQPRPNFHHTLARLRRDGTHDGIDDAPIRQKMLPEALARNVPH